MVRFLFYAAFIVIFIVSVYLYPIPSLAIFLFLLYYRVTSMADTNNSNTETFEECIRSLNHASYLDEDDIKDLKSRIADLEDRLSNLEESKSD